MYSLPGSLAVVVAPIVGLFFSRGPSAVARLVVAVIVDALDRMLRRGAWPHVSEELRKILSPTVGHGDPSATVAMVIRVILFVATTLGVEPRLILGGAGASVGPSVQWTSLFVPAATAFGKPLFEGRSVDNSFGPTFAFAKPPCSPERVRGRGTQNRPSVKLAVGEIDLLHLFRVLGTRRVSIYG